MLHLRGEVQGRFYLKRTAGVVKYDIPKENIVVITFDDEKTNAEKIVRNLTRGGAPIKGNPEYVK